MSLYEVRLPLRAPFRTSTGELSDATHLLVRLVTEDGIVGWGECACENAPNFGSETLETCWHILCEFLIPKVVGLDLDTPHDLAAPLAQVRGNHFAKSALDIAAWDVYARANNLSLAAALGGTRTKIESGVSIGLHSDAEQTVALAEQAAEHGYRRLKLKIIPGMAVDLVRAVREVSREIPIVVDANGSFPPDGLAELLGFDELALEMVEQPFAPDQLILHKRLAESIETPICLDESVPTPAQVELALDLKAADIINIKVSRLGGLSNAQQAHHTCLGRAIPVWCGGMHEFGIGRAANIAIASLPGFSLPGDVSASRERYVHDLVYPEIVASEGWVDVPDEPGIGVAVDEEFVLATAGRQRHFDLSQLPVKGGVVAAPTHTAAPETT